MNGPGPAASALGIDTLLQPAAVVPHLKVANKKQLLQELAHRAAGLTGQPEAAIAEALLERERLSSTGIGNGIAIPHGKLAGLKQPFGLFIRLDRPVDFGSVDQQPVDLIFLLLSPEDPGTAHLSTLARISRLLRQRATCLKLRGTKDALALYALLTGDQETRPSPPGLVNAR